jgi:hypothetical protein
MFPGCPPGNDRAPGGGCDVVILDGGDVVERPEGAWSNSITRSLAPAVFNAVVDITRQAYAATLRPLTRRRRVVRSRTAEYRGVQAVHTCVRELVALGQYVCRVGQTSSVSERAL